MNLPAFVLVLLASLSALVPIASAQVDADAAFNAERSKAVSLYGEGKYLEALPIFEDLAAKNPRDDKVLLGLAVCLANHSATVSDQEAAGKERVRAIELLKKAQELGNNSTLLQNLLQVLQSNPPGSQIKYSENASANEAMRAAGSAFARRDFDEAIKDYTHALELDPKNATAALFVGDTYFKKRDYVNAGAWYGRASQIDPNLETPYRYYADMLTKTGNTAGARTKAIQAVVAEPYNPITWRGLGQWADASQVQLIRVHIEAPNRVMQKDQKNVTITVQPGTVTDAGAAWLDYGMEQALWRGDKFKQQFPKETEYRHSLAEEAAALTSAAKIWSELSEKHRSSKAADADLDLVLKLYRADMIEPYVLLNGADEGISKDYAEYRDKHRAKLEQYLGDFVVPPAPLKH